MVHEICVLKIFKSPSSELKWALLFNVWDVNWREIYLIPFKSSLSTKLRYFQFKILHRYLAVNKLLFQMGIKDSDLCTFCDNITEDIPHLFWECPEIRVFWEHVQNNLLKNQVNLNLINIILGFLDIDLVKLNFVILHAKYFIYKCKLNNCIPRYIAFVGTFKSCKETERCISSKNNTICKWRDKWNVVNF